MRTGLDRLRPYRLWLFRLVCAGVLTSLSIFPARVVFAQQIPAGFQRIAEQPGVVLYRKDYPGGTPDYVQVLNLNLGARLDLLYGEPVAMDNAHNRGMFGGPNPSFRQQSIRTFWGQYASSQTDAFCVTNGQFFYMPESPTPLALPLLVDRQLLAEGFGYPQYPEKQLILALWPDRADILPLTPENLATTDAESVIGGLTEEANKKPKNAVGRTFVGIWDSDGDQRFETIAVYTTQTATQPEAARTVRSFGAVKVMMLDGGGSTQLICQGQSIIDTTRAIPQALGVSAGGLSPSTQGRAPVAQEKIQSAMEPSPTPMENANVEEQLSAPDIPESSSQPVAATPAPAQPEGQSAVLPVVEPGIQASGSAPLTVPQPAMESAQNEVAAAANLLTAPTVQATALAHQVPGDTTGADSFEIDGQTSPESAQLSYSSKMPANIRANGMDVLLLPAIISPLSLIMFYIARRHIFYLYRE